MKKFRIYIRGENFLLYNDEQIKKMGFYTTRYISSQNEKDAISKALNLIREELFDFVHNKKDNPPMMYIEEIVELESFGDVIVPGKGFTWYIAAK